MSIQRVFLALLLAPLMAVAGERNDIPDCYAYAKVGEFRPVAAAAPVAPVAPVVAEVVAPIAAPEPAPVASPSNLDALRSKDLTAYSEEQLATISRAKGHALEDVLALRAEQQLLKDFDATGA